MLCYCLLLEFSRDDSGNITSPFFLRLRPKVTIEGNLLSEESRLLHIVKGESRRTYCRGGKQKCLIVTILQWCCIVSIEAVQSSSHQNRGLARWGSESRDNRVIRFYANFRLIWNFACQCVNCLQRKINKHAPVCFSTSGSKIPLFVYQGGDPAVKLCNKRQLLSDLAVKSSLSRQNPDRQHV